MLTLSVSLISKMFATWCYLFFFLVKVCCFLVKSFIFLLFKRHLLLMGNEVRDNLCMVLTSDLMYFFFLTYFVNCEKTV